MKEEKTIAEWIETIQDPEIKRMVKENHTKTILGGSYYSNYVKDLFTHIDNALWKMFNWRKSTEGEQFWEAFAKNPTATFLELEHLLPGGSHLAKHKDDAVKEPLLKEIEDLKYTIELDLVHIDKLQAKYDRAVGLLTDSAERISEIQWDKNTSAGSEIVDKIQSFLNEVKTK